MSPSKDQMKQEEEYKNAISILNELENLCLGDSNIGKVRFVFLSICWFLVFITCICSKEQSEVIKLIETNIESCIKALIARQETLIQDVTEKFKNKRMFLNLIFFDNTHSIDDVDLKEFKLKNNERTSQQPEILEKSF
jgi:hypothetical protein